MVSRVRRMLLPLIAVALGAACSDSNPAEPDPDPNPQDPGAEEVATLTVDASADWAFVRLEDGEATLASVADPATSTDWDIAFFATSVMLNGGAAGPAGVVGHCLCGNASLDDAGVAALSAETELAHYEAVGSAQVPAPGDAWESDALAPAIDGWYSYDPQAHVVSAVPSAVWKVRTADGDAYAKFHVTGLTDAAQAHAGTITIEYALQPSTGAAFEATETRDIDVSGGPVHFDLDTGATAGSAAAADLTFEGYTVRVNGGVSGPGNAGASLADEEFDAITDASDLTAGHYRGDAFGGVFEAHPWYRYNIEGNHQIWPTYDVYLVRRGETVYKLQLISYYGTTGDSRQITARYEPVS